MTLENQQLPWQYLPGKSVEQIDYVYLQASLFYLCSRNIYRTRSAADIQLVWANNCIGNYHVISFPTVVNI